MGVFHRYALARSPQSVHDQPLIEVDVGELRLEGKLGDHADGFGQLLLGTLLKHGEVKYAY